MHHSKIQRLSSENWHLGFEVSPDVLAPFQKKKISRFLCRVNNSPPFHTAVYHSKVDGYFITLNKAQIKSLALSEGQPISYELMEDTSKYGIYLPPEMEELLAQDEEGSMVFHRLTPGKQRSLLHLVGKIKSPDIRIKRGITILDYLKSVNGRLDFKELNEAIRQSNQRLS